MMTSAEQLLDYGLEVVDLADEQLFASRPRRTRNRAAQMEAMNRLARCFVETPATILQELSNAAVEMCGADSSGISIEREDRTNEHYYHWVATAGVYTSFLDAVLPREPSACTVCLHRKAPQHFRVSKRFFDILRVEAAEVTDGILLPWEIEEMRGTIFIIAHGRTEAFDLEDLRLMQVLASFAAAGIRQQRQQARLMEQERLTAAAGMANDLAHEINNPLQSLTNLLFLAKQMDGVGDERSLAMKMEEDFGRLTGLVERLLELPRLGVLRRGRSGRAAPTEDRGAD